LGGQILTGRIIRVSFTHHLIKHKRMICICIIQSRETYHGVTLILTERLTAFCRHISFEFITVLEHLEGPKRPAHGFKKCFISGQLWKACAGS
jgi:hypothetical protein